MKTSSVGLIAGLLMAIAIAVDGFTGFLVALVLGIVGFVIGGHFDGEIDLGQVFGRRNRD